MLSRSANAVYWMSRYLERAENVARIVAVNMHLMLDMGLSPGTAQWKPLVTTSGDEAGFLEIHKEYNEENVLNFLTFDERNPNSILSCISNARENARTVRDVISSEMWEQLNVIYLMLQAQSLRPSIGNLHDFYKQIRDASHLFAGLIENTMAHGEGWHFARMGRMLERADKTARILDVKYFLLLPDSVHVDSPYDAVEWGAVLKSANAFEMYRKNFHSVNYKEVAQYIIFDTHFPRSMTYCVNTAARSLSAITKELKVKVPVQDEMLKLQKIMAANPIESVLANGLHEFIDIFQFNLNIVDQSVYRSFFAPQAA